MNRDRFIGICRQIAGSMSEAWGECFHDRLRATAGRRDQVLAKAQQAGEIAREQAAHQLKNFHHQNRNWYF